MAKLTIDVPDVLASRVQSSGRSIESVLLEALAHYVDNELPARDITQTETWKLRGRYSVTESADVKKGLEQEDASQSTNYSEHIDSVIYTGT